MSDKSRKIFELLVRENAGQLTTYLRTKVRDPGLVDELFQETLITAWNKFDQFDQTRPLAPWLRGIALNLARNACRRQQRDCLVFTDKVVAFVEESICKIEDNEDDGLRQKTDALTKCLKLLQPRARKLIQQRYEENLNATEISALTETSSAAIRKQLQRVRKALAECVSQNVLGAFPT